MLDDLLKSENVSIKNITLKIITDCLYFEKSFDNEILKSIQSSKILQTILEFLELPQKDEQFSIKLCSNALMALINLAYVEPQIADLLCNNQILQIISELVETTDKNNELTVALLGIILCLLNQAEVKNLQGFEIFCYFIVKNFESCKDNDVIMCCLD